MEKPSYKIVSSEDGLWNEFESISDEKLVKKAVGYYLFTENDIEFAELSFGDITESGGINLKVVTDNKDFAFVIGTVIITLYRFFELYPQKTVVFTGSSSSRNRLYRAIIGKLFEEGKRYFDISGITFEGDIEVFRKNKDYLAFQISIKNES
jgi:hypothetical protein